MASRMLADVHDVFVFDPRRTFTNGARVTKYSLQLNIKPLKR